MGLHQEVCRGCNKLKNLERHLWWRPLCKKAYETEHHAAEDEADEVVSSAKHGELDDETCPDGNNNLSALLYHEMRQENVLLALSRWATDGQIGNKWRQTIRSDVESAISDAVTSVANELAEKYGEEPSNAISALLRDRLDIFKGLRTERNELAYIKARMPYLEVVERKVGPASDDLVYTIVIADWLEHKMNYDARFRTTVLNSSKKWKSGELRNSPESVSDITHGAYFRQSRLSAPAAPDDVDELRVGLLLGYDDLEIASPLGIVRGKHKVACFYIALANLPAHERFQHSNMCVLMLVLEKILKRCGAVRVVAGANYLTGQLMDDDWASFGAQFRASVQGNTTITVQNNLMRLVLDLLVCSNDFPAGAVLMYGMGSTSAFKYCKSCDADTRQGDPRRPFSFIQRRGPRNWKLRTRDAVQATINLAKGATSRISRAKILQDAGMSIPEFPYYAICSDFFPGVDETKIFPIDLMHLEGDGLLGYEMYYMFYILIKKKILTLSDINKRIRGAPNHTWEDRVRPRAVHKSVLVGSKNGRPVRGKRARFTAAETHKLALASEELFGGLVSADDEPVWACWLMHVKYLRILLQHSLTVRDIKTLDILIYEHQRLYEQVPEYVDLAKPKHHFAQHMPVDIIQHGPPRGYWCFSFEGMHQTIKGYSHGSTFVNVCRRISGLWCRAFACDLHSARKLASQFED